MTIMADVDDKMQAGDDSFTSKTPPSAAYVRWFLAQGDTIDQTSPLHRLGPGPGDASPGNHKHDGRTSQYLFNPGSSVITGDLATTAGQRTAIKKIIGLLVQVGAVDSTTN